MKRLLGMGDIDCKPEVKWWLLEKWAQYIPNDGAQETPLQPKSEKNTADVDVERKQAQAIASFPTQ